MKYKITLVPGDGIGPEVTEATAKVVEAAGVDVEWETINAGAAALECDGVYLPDRLLESIRQNRVALKGPITTPIAGGSPASTSACDSGCGFTPTFAPSGICLESKPGSGTST